MSAFSIVTPVNVDLIREELASDGYSVVKGLLRHDLLDLHLANYVELHDQLGIDLTVDFYSYPEDRREKIKKARHDYHQEQPNTLELLFEPRLQALLHSVFERPPVLRQPETGFYNRRTPLHTDSLDVKSRERTSELRMWCALEDIHPDSGPVYFLKGSHRTIAALLEDAVMHERPEFLDLLRAQLPATTMPVFYEQTRPLWQYVKRNKLPRAIEDQRLAPDVQILSKGDVVLFSPDTLHGTMQCVNSKLTRKYLVAYWSGLDTSWFQARSYWSGQHDYRYLENAISPTVKRGTHGLYIEFEEFHGHYVGSFSRNVVTSVEAHDA